MRFSVITVAAAVCLIAGVQAAPAGAGPEGAAPGGAAPAAGGSPIDVTKAAGGIGGATGAVSGIAGGAGGAGGVTKAASGVLPPGAIPVKRSVAPANNAGATAGQTTKPEEAGTVQKTAEPVAKFADKTTGKVTGKTADQSTLKAAAPLKATVNGVQGSALGDKQNKGVADTVTSGL